MHGGRIGREVAKESEMARTGTPDAGRESRAVRVSPDEIAAPVGTTADRRIDGNRRAHLGRRARGAERESADNRKDGTALSIHFSWD